MTRNSIEGKITARTGQAELGPYSRIIVRLQDVTLMDRAAVTLSQTIIRLGANGRPFPFQYSLSYDAAAVDKNQRRYSMSTRIEDAQQNLKWITTSLNLVRRVGESKAVVDMVVDQVPSGSGV